MDSESRTADKIYIKKTFELAKKASGFTSPNPIVGAVVVKDGKIVGTGFHEKAGMPHAEIAALREAGEKASGATIYVNLEPCSHFGKTPPCVHSIKERGIKRVVAAMEDPNPHVSGKGFEYLLKHGIEVSSGILENKARKLNEVFVKFIGTGMPFVILKEALTLDGKIGYKDAKDKTYISSHESLKYTHGLRLASDAIMVSAKTVIKDDPRLDMRFINKRIQDRIDQKKYFKIILDSNLSTPAASKIFKSYGSVLIFTSCDYDDKKKNRRRILKEKGANVIDVYYNNIRGNSFLDLKEIYKICGNLGITSILAEAGRELFNSIASERLFDKLIFNFTPFLFGSEKGLDLFGGFLQEGGDILKLKDLTLKKAGDDFFAIYYPS